MLGFLKSKVDLVELNSNQMVFRAAKKFKEGSQHSVRVAIPPGSGKLTTLSVHILSNRTDELGHVHVAQLLDGPIVSEKVTGEALRSADRADMAIRVMSPKLPGFRAMTIDLSATGLQIEMDGALEVGVELPLTLEFDRFDLSSIDCPVQVRWCRVCNERGRYRAGFMFLPEDAEKQEKLQVMGEFFNAASQADLRELLSRVGMVKNEELPLPGHVILEPNTGDGKSLSLEGAPPAPSAPPTSPAAAPTSAAPTPPPPPAPPAPPREAPSGPVPSAFGSPGAPSAFTPPEGGGQPFQIPAAPAAAASSAAVVAAATGAAPAAPPPAAPPARPASKGLEIPVSATLAGYGWELEQETLIVILRGNDGLDQSMAFPDCRTVRDYRCFEGQVVSRLRVRMKSELLTQCAQSWDVGTKKHYEFLGKDDKVVLELVSGQCGPAA